MSIRKVFMTLDVRKAESQTTIEGLHVGDVGSTQLVISLTDGTRAIDLTKFGTVTAMIHGKKPDGYEIHNACTVEGGKIYYTLTAQDTAVSGTVYYQLDVQINGVERSFSPCFRTQVSERVYEPVYDLITDETAPDDWEQHYADYYKKVNGVYVENDDSTYAANTFYRLVDPPVQSMSQYLAFWAAYNRVSELFNKRLDIDTTGNIVHNTDNVHKVFINAAIQGNIKGVVFTMPTFKQFALCSDGFLRIRTYDGSNYSEWQVLHLKTEINASNKNKNNLIPSIKAVVDYIAAEISGKADSADVAASLAGKADVNHTHDMSAYITSTALQSALAGKADTDHTHSQYLTEHQDLSAYALIANVTAALALKADKDTAMEYKDITGSAIYQVNDDLISDKKTIYRVFDGLGWGLMFNLITNQQHTQIILREDGHLLYRQKAVNASWQGVSFTDIFSSYATTAAMTAGLAGKADISHTHDMSNYVTDSDLSTALEGKADVSDIPTVPTNVSAFTNDVGYLTQHQSLSNYYTKYETDTTFASLDELNGELELYDNQLELKESVSNKQSAITDQNKSGSHSDDYYPSVKAVADYVDSGLSDKADKATTLAGYGITDAYTKTESDNKFLTSHQSLSNYYTKNEIDAGFVDLENYNIDLNAKEDVAAKVTSISNYNSHQYYPSAKAVKEFVEGKGYLTSHQDISGKVDKVTGKGLSSNDYTTEEKNKLSGIEAGANKFPSGGSAGQVLTKSASGTEWKNIPNEYEFVNEIPQNADHSQKYVLPDGFIYVWQDGSPAVPYNANTKIINQRPQTNHNIEDSFVTANGVLCSEIIPFDQSWKYSSASSGGSLANITISGIEELVPAYNSSVIIYYYRRDNGEAIGAVLSQQIDTLNHASNNSPISIPSSGLTFSLMDQNIYFSGLDTNNPGAMIGYVRVMIGISSTNITEDDVANVKINVPFYDTPGTQSGWVSKGIKHPYYIKDSIFDVSTNQVLYAVGDSITYGYGVGGNNYSWVKHVIDHNGYAAYGGDGSKNLGENNLGFCTNSTSSFGNHSIQDVVDGTSFAGADIVTVALGINDWKNASATLANFWSGMQYCFNKIRSDNPYCKIYYILPFNVSFAGSYSTFYGLGFKGDSDTTKCYAYKLQEFINLIKAKFEEAAFKAYRVELIDMTECAAINRQNITTALIDDRSSGGSDYGLHPTAATHAVLGKEIARIIAESHIVNAEPIYVLSEQDKSDIADIVLNELPTTQGVLYGNASN